jgi:Fe-S-cluster containining protein
MISNTGFQEAAYKTKTVFEKIQSLYQQLPETTCACEEPGICCVFLPEMTLTEALMWLQLLQQMPDAERVTFIRKFVEFYLTNPIRRIGCPFLYEGYCGIYEFRAFACRAYGLWSRKMGQERTQQSREGKMMLADMWQRYGIKMPPGAIADEMDYCDLVGCKSDTKISDNRLMAILQEIYLLDNEWADLQVKFENEYHSDFSFLITSLALGLKKAVLGKLAVIKELTQEGADKRLKNLLSQIKPDGLNPMV